MKNIAFILFTIYLNVQFSQEKKQPIEVLLIGTFHFHHPGADVVETEPFDVLNKQTQDELQILAAKIKAFAPQKIFLEWDVEDSIQLNKFYQLYLEDRYFVYAHEKHPGKSFYTENEIFQLGFRAAKESALARVFPIDIRTDFPFDSLMKVLDSEQQHRLREKIEQRMEEFEESDQEKFSKSRLIEILLAFNDQADRDLDLGTYVSLYNQVGPLTNHIGVELVANWYKRNLLMYSFVQKQVQEGDQRIMILLGAGHIALFKHFIQVDENFTAVELKDILAH